MFLRKSLVVDIGKFSGNSQLILGKRLLLLQKFTLQWHGFRGEASDIWSCGIVLVAMLAGELPWESPEQLRLTSSCCH